MKNVFTKHEVAHPQSNDGANEVLHEGQREQGLSIFLIANVTTKRRTTHATGAYQSHC
jgi:hypothetical protein